MWHRHHINGVLAIAALVGAADSWAVHLSRPDRVGRELLGRFSGLAQARAAADRRASEILVHDCSLCQLWTEGEPTAK